MVLCLHSPMLLLELALKMEFDFFFFISANIMIVSHRQHSFSTEAEVLFSSAILKETKQTRVGYEHISIHSLGHKKLV